MADIPENTELITPRLRLHPYHEDHTDAFYNLIKENKLRLAPAFPNRIRILKQPEEALKLIKRFKVDWLLGQVYAFGMWQQPQNNYIGDISLKNFDYSVPKAEIAYYLDAQAEGQGLAVEALEGIIKFAFKVLEVNKLYIRCSLHNARSYSLAERCGFRREGLMRHDFRDASQKLIDIYYYGLTRPDYENRYWHR